MTHRAADTLTVHLIEELERYGLDVYEYTLQDFAETDVLELLIESGPPDTHVSFQVRDYWVTVYGDGTIDVQP